MTAKRFLLKVSAIALIAGSASAAHAADDTARPAPGPGVAGPVDTAPAGQQSTTDKQAADKQAGTDATLLKAPEAKDVVVQGVRSSLARARETKKNSKAIVDVVDAEDIGKLPNNTVGDVIASVPGISVYRTEGEVNDIQLRGLFGVQTTLGGTPIESGASRVASIADLPADLVKSVEVYKTRTPDQVEGAGAGSINIEFRKPNDFRTGFFASANATVRYNDQSQRYNQVYTGIVNYRRETAIGDMGIQLGATVNFNPFLESQSGNSPLTNVQQRQVVGPNILPLPTFAPREVFFTYQTGSRTTPSYNGALQWSPSDRDSIAIEGTYAEPTFDRFGNTLYLPTLIQAGSTNTLPALSNIKLVPGTNRIKSMTVSPVNQIGPIADISQSNDSNFLAKISATHKDEFFEFYTEIAYTGANSHFTNITTRNRFVNRPTFDIDFADDRTRYPMMNAQFRDLDLLDPSQYRFFGVLERDDRYSNRNLSTRVDLKLRPEMDFVDRIDVGFRFNKRSSQRRVSGREIRELQILPANMPEGYRELVPIAEGFRGTGVQNNARWMSYDRFAARENYDKLRQFVAQFNPLFGTVEIPEDPAQAFNGDERSIAAYGTLNYKFDVLFPISGLIGARVTNDIRESLSFNRRTVRRRVNNVNVDVLEITPNRGRGNLLFFEPTATAVLQFTPKFKARLSYNVGVRRPDVGQITPYIVLNDAQLNGSGGNPDLKPEKTTRFDTSFEYYFGRIGLITINPFYWKTKGAIASFSFPEVVEGGGEDLIYNVSRPYNSGSGYRRGVEMQAQSFFTFLPGILKSFGIQANYTYIDSQQSFSRVPGGIGGVPATLPLRRTPKHVYNIQGLFERRTLNARVSYNYNGSQLDEVNGGFVRASTYIAPRAWMDAAINYTIPEGALKNLGFSIQVQNVLADTRRSFYGFPDQPRDVIYMARVYGGTVRYKF